MEKRKILKKHCSIYKSLCNYYFKENKRMLGVDDQPLMNFLEVTYPFVAVNEYYDDDLFFDSTIRHLNKLTTLPVDIEESINLFIDETIECFEESKGTHYIIFPLECSGLKKDICFGDFYFLKKREKTEMINCISEISDIELDKVRSYMEHTQNSRSRDFLAHNMFVVKMVQQSTYMNQRAYIIAQRVIYILNVMNHASGIKNSIFRKAESFTMPNKHVAVIAEEGWRCSHRGIKQFELKCRKDLDFLQSKDEQNLFIQLFNIFVYGENADELTEKFLNAMIFFNQAVQQREKDFNNSLALLLNLTAAESLLTEEKNEKRLRLCAILSRITTVNGLSQVELAKLLDDLYKKRNDFVHAASNPYFDYEDSSLDYLQQAIAQLILKYMNLDQILDIRENESRINAWNRYVDEIFNNIIYAD